LDTDSPAQTGNKEVVNLRLLPELGYPLAHKFGRIALRLDLGDVSCDADGDAFVSC
jgi:hypothetical protein